MALVAGPAVTTDWTEVADRFYHKRHVYALNWSVDLGKMKAVGAPFGGPIALVRDEQKIVDVTADSDLTSSISIFSSSGMPLATIASSGSAAGVVAMAWNDQERLVVVADDGAVSLYSITGALVRTFSLGRDVADAGVFDVSFFPTGLVVLTNRLQLVALTSYDEPRPRLLADPQLDGPPASWTCADPATSPTGALEVLIATQAGTILTCDADTRTDQLLSNGPFTKLCVSPNGRLLAAFSAKGTLWEYSMDFNTNILEFAVKTTIPPTYLCWCGNDSVAMYWDGILLVVARNDWVKFPYDEASAAMLVVPEPDAIRLLTNSSCELLSRVPDALDDVFRIGSTGPAAMLYDAYDSFQRRSAKADENIRAIAASDELAAAVDACIEAACHEFSLPLQKSLLRAAKFGRSRCDLTYASDAFVEACKTLRVLNEVRSHEIGMPLTYTQYRAMTPEVLVDRLTTRHQHFMAWKIANYLKLKPDRVPVHWACEKVKRVADRNDTTTDLTKTIVDKLAKVSGISYAEVASTAYQKGRRELATKLLDFEPRAADQVPLLISMKEDQVALMKAIESGDTDLVYLVLLHIKRTRDTGEFFRTLASARVEARSLLVSYCREQDRDLLRDIFTATDQPMESAALIVDDAYQAREFSVRMELLQRAQQAYTQASKAAGSPAAQVAAARDMARATDEQIKLLFLQKDLENQLQAAPGTYSGMSLHDLVFELLFNGHDKLATKAQKDFRMSDKKFWWVKVKALADSGRFDALEKFSKERKSPIGYEAFADACILRNNAHEAKKYVARIEDTVNQGEAYIRLHCWKEAAEAARGDAEFLQNIRGRCTDPRVLPFIDKMLSEAR